MGPDVETHTAPLAEAAARILIVDDELPVLQAVRGVIEQMGHQTREANDGAQAIAALESESFDLVVTDLRMPNQDGFAVVRRARELPAHTPAVVLTASASIADCVEAMQAGAFNFLVKPLDRDAIISATRDTRLIITASSFRMRRVWSCRAIRARGARWQAWPFASA